MFRNCVAFPSRYSRARSNAMAWTSKSQIRILVLMLLATSSAALIHMESSPPGPGAMLRGKANTAKPQPARLLEPLGIGLKTDSARYRFFVSDIADGISLQSVATTCFLFFACLAPAVAFGGLQAMTTNNMIGATEFIISTGVCGMIYAVFSAQPLTIIGSTGPILAFTAVLHEVAKRYGLPFLPLYAWVGVWSSAFLTLGALFSTSNVVLLLTRFTDEIFSNLIALIFIYEAVGKIHSALTSSSSSAAHGLLYLVAAVSTFLSAKGLSGLRASPYFPRSVRTTLSDFGPTVGVIFGCLIATWAQQSWGIGLQTLQMPASLSTTSGRPWLVPLQDLPVSGRWAAVVPAMMVTVLLFLDHNITVRLVNSRHWKLAKPVGNHLDLLVVAACTLACSLLGLPFLAGATVRSVNHVRANAVYQQLERDRDNLSPSSAGPSLALVGVREQRVTNFAIHGLVALSVLVLRPVLSRVPLAVLMGLFLHLGTSALSGNQMWKRLLQTVTLQDPALTPPSPWKGHVATGKVTLFTLVQAGCLFTLFAVKSHPTVGVLFPLVIALLGPLRVGLERSGWFTAKDLAALDADDD